MSNMTQRNMNSEEGQLPGVTSSEPRASAKRDLCSTHQVANQTPLSRLRTPQPNKSSPPSSTHSSSSGASPGQVTDNVSSKSVSFPGRGGGRRLRERLDAAVLQPMGIDRERMKPRADGSPVSSVGSRGEPQGLRARNVSSLGGSGMSMGAPRAALSAGTSPRGSRSPETKRSSLSFEEFVANSQSEMSVSDSSRYSTTGGKRPRNRSALRVAVRIRPIIDREEGSRTVTCRGSESGLVVVNPKKFKASAELVVATALAVSRANMATSDWLRSFEFDRVFWSHPSGNNDDDGRSVHSSEDRTSARATQQSVYEGLGRRIVDDAMNGISCSCFAYGHTGSGKTYSMFGGSIRASLPEYSAALSAAPKGEGFGLMPRVCHQLLHRLKGDAVQDEATSASLSVQFVEIYNEKIRDLLHPGADSSAFRVREHPQTGPYVDNLVPVEVGSWRQLHQLLRMGSAARTEADTPENNKSSRGHAILTLEAQTPSGRSRVQMVDLAGSERESCTKARSDVQGRECNGSFGRARSDSAGDGGDVRTLSQRLRETAQIKKALSNLGIIIKGLSKGDSAVGLPFRDSILTWLLKQALSGHAHTTMLATISPSSEGYVETMNTLKYAERLRRASGHLYWNRDSNSMKIAKVSDVMKQEMKGLVEKLGQDGVEAKRQVLLQTVADPQQRIAKLTMQDPKRRRASTSALQSPFAARYNFDDDDDDDEVQEQDPRRTTLPGTPSPHYTTWLGESPQHDAGLPSARRGDDIASWGSPIGPMDDEVEDETMMVDTLIGNTVRLDCLAATHLSSQKINVDNNCTAVELASGSRGSRRDEQPYDDAKLCCGSEGGSDNEAEQKEQSSLFMTDDQRGDINHNSDRHSSTSRETEGGLVPNAEIDGAKVDFAAQTDTMATRAAIEPVSRRSVASQDSDRCDCVPSNTLVTGTGSEPSCAVPQAENSIGQIRHLRISSNLSAVNEGKRNMSGTSLPGGGIDMEQRGQCGGHNKTTERSGAESSLGPATSDDEKLSGPDAAIVERRSQVDGKRTRCENLALALTGPQGAGGGGSERNPRSSTRRVSWQQPHEDDTLMSGHASRTPTNNQPSTTRRDYLHSRAPDSIRCEDSIVDHAESDESLLVDCSGEAAALAASGLFDLTGTSVEAEGDGDTSTTRDPNCSDVVRGSESWAICSVGLEPGDLGPHRRRHSALLGNKKDLEALQALNAALSDELSGLRIELKSCKDSETRARAALAETERRAEDLQFRLASTERCLGEESERADEAERAAREEASRAQSLASDSREIARLLEDTRKRAAEAEQRAAREEERTRAFAARAAEDNDHLVTLRTALEQQAAAVEEGKNRAKDREKALEAAGREAEFALNKAHDAKEEERMRAEDAEAQAQRAFLRNQELVKLLGERDASLRKSEASLVDARAAAEVQIRRSAARSAAVVEERCRALEQVEYERRQILRLTKALSDLRANSEQDNSAAEDREAALRAQLARETKAQEKTTSELKKRLREVMEEVRSQAVHVRERVEDAEKEKADAIHAKDIAERQLEQCHQERAALWLAANKFDVMEATKDSAIQELQAEGVSRERDLDVLRAENLRLREELGRIDLSLLRALEDSELSLDGVGLKNATISRKLGRHSIRIRSSVMNDHTPSTCLVGSGAVVKGGESLNIPRSPVASEICRARAEPARSTHHMDNNALLGSAGGGLAWGRDPGPSTNPRNRVTSSVSRSNPQPNEGRADPRRARVEDASNRRHKTSRQSSSDSASPQVRDTARTSLRGYGDPAPLPTDRLDSEVIRDRRQMSPHNRRGVWQ